MQDYTLLTQVTTTASKIKSGYSRAAVFSNLKAKLLAEETSFTAEELAALYRCFMPAAPARPRTALAWVSKAMANKDVRVYLNYLHLHQDELKGTTLAATNGHRVHAEEDTETTASTNWLDKAGNPCNVDGYTYPNIWQVINPVFAPEIPRVTVANSKDWLERLPKGEAAHQKGKPTPFAFWGGQAFDLKYLQDAASLGLPCEITKPDVLARHTPIGIKFKLAGKVLRAVVMPLILSPEQLAEFQKIEASLG